MSFVRSLLPAFVLLAATAIAADPTTVRDLRVNPSGSGIKIEITLSSAQTPNVLTAVNPDRIVVELPGTMSDARQRHISVGQAGVKEVRVGLNSANPPVTRVVVDLEQMQQYSIATEGNKITLTVGTAQAATAKERPPVRENPPAAASGSVASIFRRKPEATLTDTSASATQSPSLVPSPGNAPAWEPSRQPKIITDETAAIRRPSAKAPKLGSLQEGTVFPGVGVDANATSGPPQKTISDIPEVAVAGHADEEKSAVAPGNAASAIPEVATTRQLSTDAAKAEDKSVKVVSTLAQDLSAGAPKPAPVEMASAKPPSPPIEEMPQVPASEVAQALQEPVKSAPAVMEQTPVAPPSVVPAELRPAPSSANQPQMVPEPPKPAPAPAEMAPVTPPSPAAIQPAPAAEPQAFSERAKNEPAKDVPALAELPSAAPPAPVPGGTQRGTDGVPEMSTSEVRAQLGDAPAAATIAPPALPDVPRPPDPTPSEILEMAATTQLGEQLGTRSATSAVVAPLPIVASPNAKLSSDVVPLFPPPPPQTPVAQQEAPPAEQTAPAQDAQSAAAQPAPSDSAPSGSALATQPTAKPVIMASAAAPAPEAAAPEPAVPAALAPAPDPLIEMATRTQSDLTSSFKIKFVTPGAVYLEGGRNVGLAEGMKLVVRDDTIKAPENPDGSDPRIIAELEVVSVAETSAVTEIKKSKRDLTVNDLAWLSQEDQASLVVQRTLSSTRKYPIVVSFTEGDPMDEEVRAAVPRPPLPSVNRVRGRIGLDYSGTTGSGFNSSQLGLVVRSDITRIGGTYWNLSGYWRGRMNNSSSGSQQTIQDLINRTYTMNMTYDNPTSRWVAGFGRMYLPWATSLDTLDGGYFGDRINKTTVVGVFGGSTPDPTSWNYTPGRNIAGAFVNFTGGSYDRFHYFSTIGGAESTISGRFDRPFIFVENTLSYKRLVSFSSAVQADNPPGNAAVAAPGAGLARAFLTARFQPRERISFDANYNYLRDVPTYNSALVGTGLLDKYLFQGFSGGARVEVLKNIWVYTDLGTSSRTGDGKSSLNQMYGATLSNIWRTGLSADAHYSKFDSAFGGGSYQSLSLSRNLTEGAHIEVMLGRQLFSSVTTGINGVTTTSANNSKFINSLFDINFGAHYFFQGGFTVSRGNLQNYQQFNIGVGYRFDNRAKGRK
jgi:hypothetical protein